LVPAPCKELPLLAPEYLVDLPGFARRFLRDAFLLLPDETLLVFDNYHEIAADSFLHYAFAEALNEIPASSNLIVISRALAPAAFAPFIVNGHIVNVGWNDLRLTIEETSEIAGSRGVRDRSSVNALHEKSGGWMAGIVLMAEGEAIATGPSWAIEGKPMDT